MNSRIDYISVKILVVLTGTERCADSLYKVGTKAELPKATGLRVGSGRRFVYSGLAILNNEPI